MPATITYDDSALQAMFADLEPKRRLQALRAGFRKEANSVKRTAVANLRSSLHSNADLEKGVRSQVFKKTAGFRVTVGTSSNGAGFHRNRFGQLKPVLLWAEGGTKERRTKANGRKRAQRQRASHPTGRMPRYAFMERTADQVSGTVTSDLHSLITDSIVKTAKKYGCK